jgi:hypothetical protein
VVETAEWRLLASSAFLGSCFSTYFNVFHNEYIQLMQLDKVEMAQITYLAQLGS